MDIQYVLVQRFRSHVLILDFGEKIPLWRFKVIIEAEIIDQPYSGQYEERIYDIPSPWNSQNWTWVKFSNDDFTEWCSEFRGLPINVAISKKYNQALILTSDYLYQLDCLSMELMEYKSHPQYKDLTVTPFGDFLVADYYSICIMESSLEDKELESPIKMDMIKFGQWADNKLSITCDEFLNWDNHVELELDSEAMKITVKKQNKS